MLSREVVLERVWNDDESVSNTIAVRPYGRPYGRIRQLCQRVDARTGRLIHTVYGQGYVLRAVESDEDRPAG